MDLTDEERDLILVGLVGLVELTIAFAHDSLELEAVDISTLR